MRPQLKQQSQQQQSRGGNRKASRDGPAGSEREPLVTVENLVPFCGLICCMMSLYLTSPECCGCMTKDILCCCYEAAMCCKITREPGFNWICFKCEVLNAAVGNCFQCERQCFCLDIRCSVPHFEEGPCLLNFCFITCCYQYNCLCLRCCASIDSLDDALDKLSEKKEKNQEVMRRAMGPHGGDRVHSPNPASEFDEADSQSVDSFLEAEDTPHDTIAHRRDASAVALYQLKADDDKTPGKFAGSNPTSKLSKSRSSEVTVDNHAYVTTRHGYNSSSSSTGNSSSRKTPSKSKNTSSSSSSAQTNKHHHQHNQHARRK